MAEGGGTVAVPTQIVQYANDFVDVYYLDGSRLQLSACGTAFRYYHPLQGGQHPLHGQKEIQQRSQFVTSEFRQKVNDAINFRNRFASQPFICSDLTPQENKVSLHADIVEAAWPSSLSSGDIIQQPDGSVRLVSVDEYAAVTLSAHKQYFTSEALSKVSQRRQSTLPFSVRGSAVKEAFISPIKSVHTADNVSAAAGNSFHATTQYKDKLLKNPSNTDAQAGMGNLHEPRQCVLVEHSAVSRTSVAQQNSEQKWEYVWVSQHHSLSQYPKCWQHPVNILINYLSKNENAEVKATLTTRKGFTTCNTSGSNQNQIPDSTGQVETAEEKAAVEESEDNRCLSSAREQRVMSLQRLLKKDFSDCVFVNLPKPLPLNCPSLHLHRWKPAVITEDDNERVEAAYMYGKVNVICAQGIIYRLLWKNPRAVEIYPGDGSLIRSTGLSTHFFTHFIAKGKRIEERTYSVKSPPPNAPNAPYSIAKLISRASRFLKHLCEESLQSLLPEDPCCWKVVPTEKRISEPLPTVVLEECTIPDLGHFVASSNGCIRIEFSDRTCLDMTFDPSKCLPASHQEGDVQRMKRQLERGGPLGLAPGVCRLLLRSGHYHYLDVTKPKGYERYIEMALQWTQWVQSTPGERYLFYKDTIHDPDKQQSVDSELKKIQCFNYIVENGLMTSHRTGSSTHTNVLKKPDIKSAEPSLEDLGYCINRTPSAESTNQREHDTNTFNMISIQDVLRRTTEAVSDLDRFMKVNVDPKTT